MNNRKTYIIAVSGGVDSVVLLHKLMTFPANPKPVYVVAHFDHGVRDDSASDAEFVRDLARQHNLAFESERAELGVGVSEDVARQARYTFLEKVKEKYRAEAIITAHHQDDVLETMLLNMLRGTSPRGLIGFTRAGIMRPLLGKSKQELLAYAQEHKLEWREDSTNESDAYLRNYVRRHVMPKLGKNRAELLEIREKLVQYYYEIDILVRNLMHWAVEDGVDIARSRFVILPYTVQREIMATYLRGKGVEIDRTMVERAVLAVKTLLPGKHIVLNKVARLQTQQKSVLLKIDPEHV